MSSVEAAYFKNPGDPVQIHRSVFFPFQRGQDHLVGTVDAREHRVLSRTARGALLRSSPYRSAWSSRISWRHYRHRVLASMGPESVSSGKPFTSDLFTVNKSSFNGAGAG